MVASRSRRRATVPLSRQVQSILERDEAKEPQPVRGLQTGELVNGALDQAGGGPIDATPEAHCGPCQPCGVGTGHKLGIVEKVCDRRTADVAPHVDRLHGMGDQVMQDIRVGSIPPAGARRQ
jgi:hypothetical protein